MKTIDTKWLKIKLQDGPMKEVGENGCHLQDVISVVMNMLRHLNNECPCKENECAIRHLQEAYYALKIGRAHV